MSRLKKIANAVSKIVNVHELEMLDGGCLSHVGDIIEAGAKDILVDGRKRYIKNITSYYEEIKYQAIPKTITANGVKLVPPVTELEAGNVYWLCNLVNPDLPSAFREDDYLFSQRELENRFIFSAARDATLYTNHVLLAAHKKLIESGEI